MKNEIMCTKLHKIILFNVRLVHILANNREDHTTEVSFAVILSKKQVNSHYYWEACQTSFNINDKYYAWRESKMSFWQKSLIKGIPSGKAITVMCMLAEFLFFSWMKALMCWGHTSTSYGSDTDYHWEIHTNREVFVVTLFCS